MKQTPHDPELLALLDKLVAGELHDEQAQALADRLRDDAAARRTYIEYLDLHSTLAWEASSAADLDEWMAQAQSKNTEGKLQAQGELKTRDRILQRAAHLFLGTRLRVALTVASCFLLVTLTLLAVAPAPLFVFEHPAPGDPVDRVIAGRITGSVDCVWQDSALPLGYGSTLYKGQRVELISGTAEVTFASGAVVTLRGPAAYVVDSDSRSTLRYGELAAYVPKRASGFSVQTPGALVVDRGTRFGIVVAVSNEQSNAAAAGEPAVTSEEVHVFEGAVEFSLREGGGSPQQLTANEAVRLHPDGRVEALAAAKQSLFPEDISEEGDTTTAEPLPESAHPPVTENLVLWLAADGAVRTDERRRVSVWEDMLAGDNDKAQNAAQHMAGHQPELVSNSIGGKPALRFDGDDVLSLATPSNLSLLNSSYEIFIIARSASPAIQFLLGGGVEDFEIHLNGDAGLRFIPAGFDTAVDASDLAVNGAFTDGRAHLFSARVSANEYHGIVSVDGRDTADIVTRDCRSSNNTALRLGMRHDATYPLVGEIAEVLVFRQELAPSQRNEIIVYLAEKYGLSTR